MNQPKYITSNKVNHLVWAAFGVLVMTAGVVGVTLKANAATTATDIDWGKLQQEIDDPTGGVTRAHQIEDRAAQDKAKINKDFDDSVKKCLGTEKGCSDALLKSYLKKKNSSLERVDKNAKQQVDQATGQGNYKAHAQRAVLATFQPYYDTYSSPSYSPPPSSYGGTSKPLVLPCVDLSTIGKPKAPGAVPLNTTTAKPTAR